MSKNKKLGFTIVELLVVIVTIGILASIVIVSYIGVTEKAIAVSLRSDLSNASKQLKLYQVINDLYPTINDCSVSADDAICLKPSSGSEFNYIVDNTSNPPSFTLYATHIASGMTYMITDSSEAVAVTTPEASSPIVNNPTVSSIFRRRDIGYGAYLGANIASDGGSELIDFGTCWGTTVDPTTNCLSAKNAIKPVGDSDIVTEDFPINALVSPDDKSVYVANMGSSSISMYSRSLSSGKLSPIQDPTSETDESSVESGVSPFGIIVSNDGKNAYVTNSDSDNITMYSRNTETGLLEPMSPFTISTGSYPNGIDISSDDRFIYVANGGSYSVSIYSRNLLNGELTQLANPYIETSLNPVIVKVSPDGKSVYTLHNGSDSRKISMFSRDTNTGELTSLSNPSILVDNPINMTISSDSKFVYVTSNSSMFPSGNVVIYSRNVDTGELTYLSESDGILTDMVIDVMISDNGLRAYVTKTVSAPGLNSLSVNTYIRNPSTGLLSFDSSLDLDYFGYFSAISNDSSTIYTLDVDGGRIIGLNSNTSTGELSKPLSPVINSGDYPIDSVISEDGKNVYVLNQSDNTISMFSKNSITGALVPLSTPEISTGNYSSSLVISKDGKSVYVASIDSQAVYMYSRDENTGILSPLSTPFISAGQWPNRILISSDDKNVYISDSGDGILMYSRNLTTGLLTPLSTPSFDISLSIKDIKITNDGNFIYIIDNFNTIRTYSRNVSTGLLSNTSHDPVQTNGLGLMMSITPDDKHVYVIDDGFFSSEFSNMIYIYERNIATGELTYLSDKNISTQGSEPEYITTFNEGKLLAVYNVGSQEIVVFERNVNTGELSLLNQTIVDSSERIRQLSISNDSKFLYALDAFSSKVYMFAINTGVGGFAHMRTDIPPLTRIYYRSYATNSFGTTYTSSSSFVTGSPEPS